MIKNKMIKNKTLIISSFVGYVSSSVVGYVDRSDGGYVSRLFYTTIFSRYYSKSRVGRDYTLFYSVLLKLKSSIDNKGFIVNEDTERFIEQFLINEFDSDNKNTSYLGDVNTDMLGGIVSKYILSKEGILTTYIGNLAMSLKQEINKSNNKKEEACFTYEVISTIGTPFIRSICTYHFLILLTHYNTVDGDNYDYNSKNNLLSISIDIGKTLVQKYFVMLRNIKPHNQPRLSYSQ